MNRIASATYRRQHLRMVLRARWHRMTSGGVFPSAVAASIGLVLALILQVVELRHVKTWCTESDLVKPLCEIPLDMSVSLQAAVGLGVLGSVGVVFSILLVSLQLVSGQFSPRLVQAVFRDHRSKSLVALLVGVFVFAMTSLFSTIVLASTGAAPGLNTVAVGFVGVIAGIALVMMLYGVAQRQYIGSILDAAARSTIEIIEAESRRRKRQRQADTGIPLSVLNDIGNFPERLGSVHIIHAKRSGWVQQLTSDALFDLAPDDCVIRLETRVGAFIPKGAPLASIWPRVEREGRQDLSQEEKQALYTDVNLTAYVGTARTMQDDADFGLRQITDVFLRAMSPAVNDPSTAIEALMRTTTVLLSIVTNVLPDQIDQEATRGVVILRPWDLDSEEYIRHGLDQVRQAAFEQPATAIAFLRVVTHLREAVDEARHEVEAVTDPAERASGLHHLHMAERELVSQRAAMLESVRHAGYTQRDLDYVLRGLQDQRPDVLGDHPPA